MARYIDADKMRDNAIRMGFHSTTMTISEFINLQPTADVRENVRGEWKESNKVDRWICSVCNVENRYAYAYFTGRNGGYKMQDYFCPNCGADMRDPLTGPEDFQMEE